MRVLTAGESHGPQLTAIIEGIPSGLTIDIEKINRVLAERQQGYGRGGRMKIETDCVVITSGVRHKKTLGSPITLTIENKNFKQWQKEMAVTQYFPSQRVVLCPRPGHADLVGGLKRRFIDLRQVLERSSARETAMRVAVGALCSQLLEALNITHYRRVLSIHRAFDPSSVEQFLENPIINDELGCVTICQNEFKEAIEDAIAKKTTVGGIVQTIVTNLPVGLGDYTQWMNKLDARLSYYVMSINAFKGVSFGDGFELTKQYGYECMDEIGYDQTFYRYSNHLGGIEGGMTTGAPLVVNGAMKPIPTQYQPLKTVDILTKTSTTASIERSDYCAVPAASVVMEYVIVTALAEVILSTFDGSCLERLQEQIDTYRKETAYGKNNFTE